MTAKDKTEDQLLASIRKNKPATGATPRKPTAKKAPPRAAAPKPVTTTPEDNPASSGSSFQPGRRVWPD